MIDVKLMEKNADIIRVSSTALLMKHPVLVVLTIAFILGLLATHYVPGGTSAGGIGPWIGLTLLVLVCAGGAWLLCSSEAVEIDPRRRVVTQRHLFLRIEIARNEWNFDAFTGVRVEQVTSTEQSAATSPGSGGYQGAIKTTHRHGYKISLVRPDVVVTVSDRRISAPTPPLELPMVERESPLPLEQLALRLSTLGGWPATRRGYVLVKGVAGDTQGSSSFRGAPSLGDTAIDAE